MSLTTDLSATAGSAAGKAATRQASAPGQQPPRRRTRKRRERIFQWLFLIPAVVYMTLFFGYPVIKNVIMSFQEYTTSTFFTGEAPWVGFANYVTVLSSSLFSTSLLNTVLFTIGSIVGQFVLGLALAIFFQRKFPLNGILRSLLLLPWLLPLIVSSAVWRWILDKDSGALNRFLGDLGIIDTGIPWLTSTSLALIAVVGVNIWIGIPFNLTILYGGLQEIPDELYEAGSLDGATGWKAFRHITWPMLRPVVSVVLVLGVVYTLKVLDIILGLTNGGPANSTQTIATQSYNLSFHEFKFGEGAALGNVLVIISLVFAVLYLRASRRAVDE
ncbi:multiple sugar transport system permease protein [Paenarthrobacter nitroguajacolicus]|uniref:carbohydrate ABC transporter permease n=1 Tax=Paenarthrobacter nitroguajacolicus TaxID=211146 RepID=UPI00285D9777|nr:sugar ABC transporter permease [Paenarthrobacter nitroguajacolicus]MDR6988015.1 multiple sugar transport system permease protein [Paenarthrobacter nitroguajacolicus]